jgi:hypothetical protein
MNFRIDFRLSHQISSDITIWLLSLLSGLCVFIVAIFFQWLIYDDWMHDKGSLRVVGSILAGGLMFAFALSRQIAIRNRKVEMLRRFETIKWMNDRIRNALQAIECITYATNSHATEPVRNAVDKIEDILHEVLVDTALRQERKLTLNSDWIGITSNRSDPTVNVEE